MEAFFLIGNDFDDEIFLFSDFGILVAHHIHNHGNDFSEEYAVDAEELNEAGGSAQDAAEHITAAVVGRQNAVGNQECAGTGVVRHDAHGESAFIFIVRQTGFVFDKLNEILQKIGIVVGRNILKNGRHAFQTHTRIDAGMRERRHIAFFIAVELHENEVPNLKPTVAVAFADTAVGAAGKFFAAIVMDLTAGAAGAGIAHRPEVIFFTEAENTVGRDPCHLLPEFKSFVIVVIDGDIEMFFIEFQNFGKEFPGVTDGAFFEVIAEGEVPHHFKKCMVAGGFPYRIQIVMLAAGANAFLRGSRAFVGAFFQFQKSIFELNHTRVGKEQCGIVVRHQ